MNIRIINIITVLLLLVEVQAQVVACHNSRNCRDTNPFSIDLALCQTQFLSYVDSEGNCINFRISKRYTIEATEATAQ